MKMNYLFLLFILTSCPLKANNSKENVEYNYNQPLTVKSYKKYFTKIHQYAPNLKGKVLKLALKAYNCAQKNNYFNYNNKSSIITIIDYSLPSTKKRLWVIDLKNKDLLFNSLVAHGKNTGYSAFAKNFSNELNSLKSSIGLFKTGSTYKGEHGYSLKMYGLEHNFNDLAYKRNIVFHGANYVSETFSKMYGRLGNSWGCPAIEEKMTKPIIDTIKEGSLVFAYYPNSEWIKNSEFLNCTNSKKRA